LIWQALHVKPIHMWSHYLFLNNVCLLHQSLNPNFDNTQHVQASCVRSTDMHHTMSLSIHSSHMLVIFSLIQFLFILQSWSIPINYQSLPIHAKQATTKTKSYSFHFSLFVLLNMLNSSFEI
jgi:hypothetical protein